MMGKKEEKIAKVLKGVILVGTLIIVAVIFFTGSVDVEFGKTSLKLDATLTSAKTVKYSDIKSVEYIKDFQIGHRSFGVGTKIISAGKFKNDLLGSYQLYSWSSCNDVIILHTRDTVYAFNGKSQGDTELLYNELKQYMEE